MSQIPEVALHNVVESPPRSLEVIITEKTGLHIEWDIKNKSTNGVHIPLMIWCVFKPFVLYIKLCTCLDERPLVVPQGFWRQPDML